MRTMQDNNLRLFFFSTLFLFFPSSRKYSNIHDCGGERETLKRKFQKAEKQWGSRESAGPFALHARDKSLSSRSVITSSFSIPLATTGYYKNYSSRSNLIYGVRIFAVRNRESGPLLLPRAFCIWAFFRVHLLLANFATFFSPGSVSAIDVRL